MAASQGAASIPAATTQVADMEWELVKKRRKEKNGVTGATDGEQRRPRSVRTKPAAVLVSIKNMSYADMLKEVKSKADPVSVGANISRIRKTKTGDLLLELERGAKPGEIQTAVTAALGGEASMRQLTPRVTLEIGDIEEGASTDDVMSALLLALDPIAVEDATIKAVRPASWGTQLAVLVEAIEQPIVRHVGVFK